MYAPLIISYSPNKREYPPGLLQRSAWGDIPAILKDLIDRFNVKQKSALEFGVEYGYSTSALSYYFETVIGVDTFSGDLNSGMKSDHYTHTKTLLSGHKNVRLIQADYRDFICGNEDIYDLIHVDIVHSYEHTYQCGKWAVNHAKVVLFHDTESFSDVKKACVDLSKEFNLAFYNYKASHGLGILIHPDLEKVQ